MKGVLPIFYKIGKSGKMQTAEITLSPDEIRVLETLAAMEHNSGMDSLPKRMLREVNAARLRHMDNVAVFMRATEMSPIDEDLKARIKSVCDDYVRHEQGRVTFRMPLTASDVEEAARMACGVSSWSGKVESAFAGCGLSISLSGESRGENGLLPAEHP